MYIVCNAAVHGSYRRVLWSQQVCGADLVLFVPVGARSTSLTSCCSRLFSAKNYVYAPPIAALSESAVIGKVSVALH